jgi:hypothetical protein
VRIANQGNSHFIAQKVTVNGRDANGSVVVREQFQGWYVLAHGRRTYEFALPTADCARLAKLDVSVETSVGTKRHSSAVPPEACR